MSPWRDGRTNKKGKIGLLSQWTMEGWDEQLSPPLQNNRALSPSAAPPPPVSWRKLNQLKIKQTPSSSKSMTLKPPNTKSLASPPERHKSSFLGRCGTSLALATRDSSLILYITARPVLTLESDKLRDSGSFSKPLASGFWKHLNENFGELDNG